MYKGIIAAGILGLAIAGGAFAAPVNVNTADAKTIAKELKGIGIKKAEAIVAYRKAHGPFHTLADLTKVKGIGAATVTENKADIRFGDAPKPR